MGDLERFFMRDFFSSFAGRTALTATLTLAPLLALAAPTPWQKLAPTLFEHLVPAGEIDPDHIHTPGIFVKRIIEVGTGKKRIEFRNTRPRPAA